MLPKNEPYLIAETAFHHEGDRDFLFDLVKAAKECGASAIKFHLLFDLDAYMVPTHPGYESMQEITLPAGDWPDIFAHARDLDLDIVALCNDVESAKWVNSQQVTNVRVVELHATGINDYFLLLEASRFEGTVMLGVGGTSFEEIKFAIDLLRENGKTDIFLMHGFQSYPTDFSHINLSRMSLYQHAFGFPIGYADHTDPTDTDNEFISVLGVANGYNVMEKHLTHKFGHKRIDSHSAVSVDQFRRIRELMHKVWLTRGEAPLNYSGPERSYGEVGPMKKAVVAKRDIKEGELLSSEMLAFKRTKKTSSLAQRDFGSLLGAKVLSDIKKDEQVDFGKVEYRYLSQDFSYFKTSKS